MANEYLTRTNLKLALGITDTDRDTLLDYALSAASRAIDAYCGRRFYADGAATARTYRLHGRVVTADDGSLVMVEDISATTGLVVELGTAGGSDWTAITDYETDPDNAIAKGQPITGLRRIRGSWSYGHASARLRVTARWGWPAVPDAVVQATLILASRLYKRKDSPDGVLGNAEWGVIRIGKGDADVRELLSPFVLPSFA